MTRNVRREEEKLSRLLNKRRRWGSNYAGRGRYFRGCLGSGGEVKRIPVAGLGSFATKLKDAAKIPAGKLKGERVPFKRGDTERGKKSGGKD